MAKNGRLCLTIIVTRLNALCDHVEKCVHIAQKNRDARAADTIADETPIAIAGDKPALQQAPQMVGDVGLR